MECDICGIGASKERLYEAVSKNGLIAICRGCALKGDFPIVKRPTTTQLKESESPSARGSIYRQMQKDAIKNRTLNIRVNESADVSLKDLVNKNYKLRVGAERKPRPDLVDNFHWLIMRARRSRKVTREQLAKEISESEAAIKMAEDGILPEDDYKLVSKLESFLGIKLLKDKARQESMALQNSRQPARILKLDSDAAKNITISDLQRMKRMREEAEIFELAQEADSNEGLEPESQGKNVRTFEEDGDVIEFEDQDEDDLSDEEIRDLIFRK